MSSYLNSYQIFFRSQILSLAFNKGLLKNHKNFLIYGTKIPFRSLYILIIYNQNLLCHAQTKGNQIPPQFLLINWEEKEYMNGLTLIVLKYSATLFMQGGRGGPIGKTAKKRYSYLLLEGAFFIKLFSNFKKGQIFYLWQNLVQ